MAGLVLFLFFCRVVTRLAEFVGEGQRVWSGSQFFSYCCGSDLYADHVMSTSLSISKEKG